MNLTKHADFFNPMTVTERINIIGCGAIGSTLAESLVRLGCDNIHLYDFDIVEAHNIPNQMFRHTDIGRPKTDALIDQLKQINPSLTVTARGAYKNQRLAGFVFLAVDNIELRHNIMKANETNKYIRAMFDFRLRLSDAQHYAANWNDARQIENMIASSDFSEAEAKDATPVSACGTALTVISTVRMVVAVGVSNFINFVKGGKLQNVILIDAHEYALITM